MKTWIVRCPYCPREAVLVDDTEVYPRTYFGKVYLCRPCRAWVGCHNGSNKPLGRLANAELRALKIRAHALFDPLWRRALAIRGGAKTFHRNAAYRWLAGALGIDPSECHFGMMDQEQITAAIEFLENFYARTKEKAHVR